MARNASAGLLSFAAPMRPRPADEALSLSLPHADAAGCVATPIPGGWRRDPAARLTHAAFHPGPAALVRALHLQPEDLAHGEARAVRV